MHLLRLLFIWSQLRGLLAFRFIEECLLTFIEKMPAIDIREKAPAIVLIVRAQHIATHLQITISK